MKRSNLLKSASPIPLAFALELIDNYKNSNNQARYIHHKNNLLTEFKFPVSIMKTIVSTDADRLFLALGAHEEEEDSFEYTLIAMLMDYKGNLDVDEGSSMSWDHRSQVNLTLSETKGLIRNYRENRPIPYKQGVQKTLKGCSFPMAELELLINQPEIGTQVEFVIGYHEETFYDNDQLGYTLIMFGLKADDTRITANRIYDFCDPCPKKCPDNIDFPYFQ